MRPQSIQTWAINPLTLLLPSYQDWKEATSLPMQPSRLVSESCEDLIERELAAHLRLPLPQRRPPVSLAKGPQRPRARLSRRGRPAAAAAMINLEATAGSTAPSTSRVYSPDWPSNGSSPTTSPNEAAFSPPWRSGSQSPSESLPADRPCSRGSTSALPSQEGAIDEQGGEVAAPDGGGADEPIVISSDGEASEVVAEDARERGEGVWPRRGDGMRGKRR